MEGENVVAVVRIQDAGDEDDAGEGDDAGAGSDAGGTESSE